MSSTTTEHLKALLVDDGREFAMVRKADLAALVQIADTDPHQGRYLDPIGELRRTLADREAIIDELCETVKKNAVIALKHGDERRRYMANNRALLANEDGLRESLRITREAQLWADHYLSQASRELRKESAKVARFERFLARYPGMKGLFGMMK